MSDVPCRVTHDLNKWQAGQWDCTCDQSKPGEKCAGCFYNDPDYFDEPDTYCDD